MEETFTYDNYVQDPTCQQGFNRYAYCFYNPLKYIDPSGERCYGPSEAEKAQMSWNAARQQRQSEIYGEVCQQLQSGMRPNGILDVCGGIAKYFNTVCSEGNSTQENESSGDGKSKSAYKTFHGVNNIVTSDRGKCVLGSLGSTKRCWDEHRWGESTKEWTEREKEFCEYKKEQDPNFDGHGYETGYFKEFLEYNPDPSRYNSYVAITGTGEIRPDQIYDLMNDGFVVAVSCILESGETHFANISSCTVYDDNSVRVEFSNPNPTVMPPLDYISTNGTYTINPSSFSSPQLVAYKLTIWKH